jgi:hypothetical protein
VSRCKTAFALACGIRELVRRHPAAIVGDATFAENITDVTEAHRRWRNLLGRMERIIPGIKLVGCWERQKRGAWHVHYVASNPIPIEWLRRAAVECGFGPQMRLDFVAERNGFRARGVENTVSYLCKYLSKDLAGEEERGARMVFYHGGVRACNVRFSWVRGFSGIYRRGRALYAELFGPLDPCRLHSTLSFIMRLGFEAMSDEERWSCVSSSPMVRRWWYGPDGEDSSPFPF